MGYPYIGDIQGRKLRANRISAYSFPTSARQARITEGVMHIYSRFGSPTAHVQFQLLKDDQLVGVLPSGTQKYIARNDHSYFNYDYVLSWRGGMVPVPQSDNNGCDAWMDSEDETIDSLVQVPSGLYTIRTCVLKIFGDPKIEEDWETWFSPSFEVIG
jgi:hypothetical protein